MAAREAEGRALERHGAPVRADRAHRQRRARRLRDARADGRQQGLPRHRRRQPRRGDRPCRRRAAALHRARPRCAAASAPASRCSTSIRSHEDLRVSTARVVLCAASPKNRTFSFQSGADAFLVRPFHLDELTDADRRRAAPAPTRTAPATAVTSSPATATEAESGGFEVDRPAVPGALRPRRRGAHRRPAGDRSVEVGRVDSVRARPTRGATSTSRSSPTPSTTRPSSPIATTGWRPSRRRCSAARRSRPSSSTPSPTRASPSTSPCGPARCPCGRHRRSATPSACCRASSTKTSARPRSTPSPSSSAAWPDRSSRFLQRDEHLFHFTRDPAHPRRC